jgi:hypothetical protein
MWRRARVGQRARAASGTRVARLLGLGLIVVGMTHQGWDVQLTAYSGRDWRATFFAVGIAQSIVGGSTWERTPWWAVQRAGVRGAQVTLIGAVQHASQRVLPSTRSA